MLEASNLECVRGEKSLFRDLSFRLEAGACLMVQGANGSGKTSLLRMLCGLAQPAQGEIRWGGEPIRKLAEDYRGGAVQQAKDERWRDGTVEERLVHALVHGIADHAEADAEVLERPLHRFTAAIRSSR